MKSLYESSLALLPTYSSVMAEYQASYPGEILKIPKIEFQYGDFLKVNLQDADIIYLNCWLSPEIMDIIGEMPLKSGTLAISVSRNF